MYDDFILLGALIVLALNIVVVVAVCQTAARTGKIYKLLAQKEEGSFNIRLLAASISERDKAVKMLSEAFIKELRWGVIGKNLTEDQFREHKATLIKKYERNFAFIGESVPPQLSLMTLETARWLYTS